MVKLFFFDCETTGLDSKRCAIHQMSGMVTIDGEVKERFDIRMCPFDGAVVSDDALDVAGVTREQITQYPSQEDGYMDLLKILCKYVNRYDRTDKFYIVGYNNAKFDNEFLREFFLRNGDKYFGSWFWANCLDVMILATPALIGKRPQMENFKQGTVAKALGITLDESKLHDAEYDIDVCKMIFDKVCGGANGL